MNVWTNRRYLLNMKIMNRIRKFDDSNVIDTTFKLSRRIWKENLKCLTCYVDWNLDVNYFDDRLTLISQIAFADNRKILKILMQRYNANINQFSFLFLHETLTSWHDWEYLIELNVDVNIKKWHQKATLILTMRKKKNSMLNSYKCKSLIAWCFNLHDFWHLMCEIAWH